MTDAHLLPPSSTQLETAVAIALGAAHTYPVPFRAMWNPVTCPAAALPFLAWGNSVDWWNESWPEATKRAVIAASFKVHQTKGTIGALRRVVEPFGYTLGITEWWQTTPPGPRATFDLEINLNGRGLTETDASEIERLIDETRPLTRHPGRITFVTRTRSTAPYVGAATISGEHVVIRPRSPACLVSRANTRRPCAIVAGEHVIIRPRMTGAPRISITARLYVGAALTSTQRNTISTRI